MPASAAARATRRGCASAASRRERDLPWKRTDREPPLTRRKPDPELEELAEERQAPAQIRPLTDDELKDAARGLFQTGNAFSRSAVRSALAAGELPLSEADEYPRAEFASSTTGTLLIRIWRHPGEQPKPRPATEADREAWPRTFSKFIEACFECRGKASE
jgi:hypothetical protein